MKKILLLLFSISLINSCSSGSEEPPPPPIKYTLTTAANPTAGGTVTPASGQHNEDATVSITATPAGEYLFSSWSGATGTTATTSVVMNSNKTVTANFIKKKYALTTTVEGEGTVTEKVIKAGAATDYNSGTIVELTAVPSGEWLFVEWKGDVTGTENPTQITIDKAKSVTAVFVKKQYPLTIEIEGEGTVAEKVIKAGAATDYNSGTIVELTATPKDGWEFKEWQGDITGTDNPKEITIDKAKTITAVFTEKSKIYLDENGITVKCDDAEPGIILNFNDKEYYVVKDRNDLKNYVLQGGTSPYKLDCVCTSLLTDLSDLWFEFSTMNGDSLGNISNWDVSNVTTMSRLFEYNSVYKYEYRTGDISNWDVSSDKDFSRMFYKNRFVDDSDISKWNVGNGENFSGMFFKTTTNSKIDNWDMSNAKDLNNMFAFSTFNQDIGSWDVSNVTNMQSMFAYSTFNKEIESWNTGNVVDMSFMFRDKSNGTVSKFNQKLSSWDVSKVTNMASMFSYSIAFNQEIGSWDTSGVTNMNRMFESATAFNQDIGSWNVKIVEGMGYMFKNASEFNQDLTKWCVTNIESEPDSFSTSSALSEANKPVWGTCPGNSYGIAVTASSNADYTLSGKDRNGDVSGNDPGLTFKVGDEVTFSVNAANHPFYLKTASGTGTGNQISGVTNQGTTNGSVVWTPSEAGTYYYQCSAHSGMVGTITIE